MLPSVEEYVVVTYTTSDQTFDIVAKINLGTPNTLDYIQLKTGQNPPVSMDPTVVGTLSNLFTSFYAYLANLGIIITPPV